MTAIVILAAGSSSRFGTPKQNFCYNGQTFLQTAVNNALAITPTVLVVLGANHENIEFYIKDTAVNILYNTTWQKGMASSIVLAVKELQSVYPEITAAIFMLCDQPFADAVLLQKLVDAGFGSLKNIVACAYNNTLGVPVLFKASYFPYLLSLTGKEGARKLIIRHEDDVLAIPFALGAIDIDTMEDLKRLPPSKLLP